MVTQYSYFDHSLLIGGVQASVFNVFIVDRRDDIEMTSHIGRPSINMRLLNDGYRGSYDDQQLLDACKQ